MAKWKEQLHRILRWKFRLDKLMNTADTIFDRDAESYADDFQAFFIECCHMRDWLIKDEEFKAATDDEIYAVRLLSMEPSSHRAAGPLAHKKAPDRGRNFLNFANEKLRILGEIVIRRTGPLDPQGNPDTSFLAKIPADVPFTFQTLDQNGMVLNMSRPGTKFDQVRSVRFVRARLIGQSIHGSIDRRRTRRSILTETASSSSGRRLKPSYGLICCAKRESTVSPAQGWKTRQDA